MDFQIAEKKYQTLKNQLESGKLTPQMYQVEIEKLRFQSKNGVWWQLNGDDGTWLRYNGQSWEPYVSTDYMGPKTLRELMIILIKNLPKSIFKSIQRKLMFAVIAGVLVLVVHTILLIGPNGGFAPSNVFFNNILALQGRVMTGTLFWMIATGVALSTYYRIKKIGFKAFQETLTNTVQDYVYVVPKVVKEKTSVSAYVFVFAAGIGMAYTLISNDGVLSLLIAAWFMLALAAGTKSFTYLVTKLSVSDIRRAMKKKGPLNKRMLEIGFYGAITALIVASIIMRIPFNRWLRIACVVAVIVWTMGHKKKGVTTSLFMLIGSGMATLGTLITHADDGGWSEAGGTLGGWIQSEGAAIAVMMGVPPAVGTAIAIGILDSLIDILMTPMDEFPEVDIVDPMEMPPVIPPVEPPVQPPIEPPVIPPVVPPVQPPEGPIDGQPPRQPSDKTPEELQKEKERLEAERKKAEAEKQKAEAERKRKEEERKKAEAERKRKEAERKKAAEEARRKAEAERKRIEKEKKIAALKERQKKLEAESAAANKSAWWWDVGTKAVESVQKVADVSIDVLATVTGPAGQRVKDIYTFGKGVGEGVGNSIAEGGNVLRNVAEGATKGAYDVLKGKALDKLAGIGNNKVPGLKQYGPGDNVGEIWKNGRVGFIKDALTGKNTHSTVSGIVRDQFKEGAKNAAQAQAQNVVTGPVDGTAKGWISSGFDYVFGKK